MANTVPIHALTLPQWGLETNTAPGTPSAPVAATKKMAVKDFLIRPIDAIAREQILKGLAIANRGNEVVLQRGVDWEVPETSMVYDELHYWFGMAVPGAPVKTGTGPFTWTSTLDPTMASASTSSYHLRTIELGLTSHVSSDNSDWEIPAAFLREIEFVGAANNVVKMSARGSGRRLQPSTRTAALALFPIQEVPTALSKVYIDSTWASRGTTQITGQIIGWRFKIATGLHGQVTADGRSDLDYSVVLLNPDERRWSIEIDMKAQLNTGQWQTEKTAAEAGTLRAVEIRTDFAGAVAYQTRFQALCKHTAGSVFPDGRENGEVTVKLSLEGSTDDTNALAMIVTNNITAAIA